MEEKISVIIPVHNSSKYLKSCLESILNQTYKNIEIIVVENGSTDNSLEVLKNYKDKIKIEVLEKGDIGKARNKGIEASSGKYICFIDSDDSIDKTFIEKLYKSIKENNTDLCICDILEKHIENNKEVTDKNYPSDTLNKEDILTNLEKFNYGPCNKLFKMEIIKKNKIKFPENIKYEDVPFVLKYLVSSSSVSKVNESLYIYNIHKESEQRTVDKRIFHMLEIMDMCLNITKKEYIESLYVKNLITFALKTRYIKDKKIRSSFINEVYKDLNLNFPDWKKCKFIKSKSISKQIIMKNKLLLSLYTSLYPKMCV